MPFEGLTMGRAGVDAYPRTDVSPLVTEAAQERVGNVVARRAPPWSSASVT